MYRLLATAILLGVTGACSPASSPELDESSPVSTVEAKDDFVCPIEVDPETAKALCEAEHAFNICGDPEEIQLRALDAKLEFLKVTGRNRALVNATFNEAAMLAAASDEPGCEGPELAELSDGGVLACKQQSVNLSSIDPAEIPDWLRNVNFGVSAEAIAAELPNSDRGVCSSKGHVVACDILRQIWKFDPDKRFKNSDIKHPKIPQRTVLALLPSSVDDAETIILGAHIDSFPGSPGVEDNLSGVVLLLTVMNTIVEWDLEFPWNLQFAFYAGEEFGLIGSRAHRAQVEADEKLETIKAVMNFDMVGRDDDQDGVIHLATHGSESYEWKSLDVGPIIAQHMADKLIVVPIQPAPNSDNITWQTACRPVASFRKLKSLAKAKKDWYHLADDTTTEGKEIETLAAAVLVILREWS